MTKNKKFFNKREEHSEAKSLIVSKYFDIWSKIMKSHVDRMAYVDLFCGPGTYGDGSDSTPMKIIRKVLENEEILGKIKLFFNDKDSRYIQKLKENIECISGANRIEIDFSSQEVTDQLAKKIAMFNGPCLSFVDPFGYSGLTKNLVKILTSGFGSDCIFFLNYNRIQAAIRNSTVEKRMNDLFGKDERINLARKSQNLDRSEKEKAILEALSNSIKNELQQGYVLPFAFRNIQKTTHHLIFVSKHILAYEKMKEVMAAESVEEEGVAKFEYVKSGPENNLLFLLNTPFTDLKEDILKKFAGRTISLGEIYEQHHVGTKYIEKNYKRALLDLINDGRIKDEPTGKRRRKGTFGKSKKVVIPTIEKQKSSKKIEIQGELF